MSRNDKGTRETTRNVLNMKETFTLRQIVLDEYVKSGLDNEKFAAKVNEAANGAFRAPITASHIMTMLTALEIPNNTRRDPVGDCLGLVARVQALEDQVAKMAAFLRQGGMK